MKLFNRPRIPEQPTAEHIDSEKYPNLAEDTKRNLNQWNAYLRYGIVNNADGWQGKKHATNVLRSPYDQGFVVCSGLERYGQVSFGDAVLPTGNQANTVDYMFGVYEGREGVVLSAFKNLRGNGLTQTRLDLLTRDRAYAFTLDPAHSHHQRMAAKILEHFSPENVEFHLKTSFLTHVAATALSSTVEPNVLPVPEAEDSELYEQLRTSGYAPYSVNEMLDLGVTIARQTR